MWRIKSRPLRGNLLTVPDCNYLDALRALPRHLVVMDVDSTLITAEVIEMLANEAGSGELVADITDRAMRGELDFAASLRERVATLKGLPQSVFAEVSAQVELSQGAERYFADLAELGWPVALVSGGFEEIVGPLAQSLGIEHFAANCLELAEDHLTGKTIGPVIDRAAKAEKLQQFAAELGIDLAHTIAVGDGANDCDMVQTAAIGVAFNAKPALREVANISVDGGLDQVLPAVATLKARV